MTVRDEVLDVVRSFGPISTAEVAEETHRDRNATYSALARLRAEVLVAVVGRGTSTRWVATAGPLPDPGPPLLRDLTLERLREIGPATLREVAEALGKDRASTHRALSVLARRGLARKISRWPVRWLAAG